MNPPKADRETGNPLAGLSGAQQARIIWPSSGVPTAGSGQAHPAKYHSGTVRVQPRGSAGRLSGHLHGLPTTDHNKSGLAKAKSLLTNYTYMC